MPALTWTSADPAIAQVTASGLLLALNAGTVSISVTGGSLAGSKAVTIDPDSAPAGAITISVGPEEAVFRWESDRCQWDDIPDVWARAVRLADGSLMVLSGHYSGNYVLVGPDFTTLKRRCTPTLRSDFDAAADHYNSTEWLESVYREGDLIHGFIHNEYHDPFASNCLPGVMTAGNPCWYNALTYAVSTDAGNTFRHASAPQHAYAPPWTQWLPPTGSSIPYGYFDPGNILHSSDGYYYQVVRAIDPAGDQALCTMRTENLADPSSWRAWDGADYTIAMTSPYTGPPPARCARVGFPETSGMSGSVTYNTYLQKYMLVSHWVQWGESPVCGFFFSLSPDLIHWSTPQLIRRAYLPFASCQNPVGVDIDVYPSIIAHDDRTVNFEKPGRTPFLYFSRMQSSGPDMNRDLFRTQLIITVH